MPTDNDGVMIILSSPSGAGKTTLVSLLSKLDNFEVSISHTTREPRPGETPDKDYFFIKEEKFKVGDQYRRRAIAKNSQGITILQGEPSFSAEDQILLDELAFYIVQNNLKAD